MKEKTSRSARRRRALNIIWTSAGAYGFQPEFMAFRKDGEPDLYLNSIVGFVHRHYDTEKLASYVHRVLDSSLLRELFTDLLWLGLEQAAYERELPGRFVLKELREAHARQYLEDDVDLSMQQLMMRNEIVHTMKCGRCREILGQSPSIRNPWDRKLYEALRFSGSMTTDEILNAMEDIIQRFFLFRWTNLGRKTFHLALHPRLLALMRKYLPMQKHYVDALSPGVHPVLTSGISAGPGKGIALGKNLPRKTEEKLALFYGDPLFAPQHLADIEMNYCHGIHASAHLWFTAQKQQILQQNTDWYARHQTVYRTELRQLRDSIRNCLMIHRQPMELLTRHGELRPGQVWRGLYLHDARIFSARESSTYGTFSVLLLLDASCSRENQQPVIASQAYIIAEALRLSNIPISIASFYSLEGYTVLQRIKDFTDTDSSGVFSYAAKGWNRDGLAYRAIPELLTAASGKLLLLILTDACPSDNLDIPSQGLHLSQTYAGDAAVGDTALGLSELRQQGIRPVGIINSVFPDDMVRQNAKKIFGEDYVRISHISDLANTVGDLLQKQISQI